MNKPLLLLALVAALGLGCASDEAAEKDDAKEAAPNGAGTRAKGAARLKPLAATKRSGIDRSRFDKDARAQDDRRVRA